MSVLKLVVSKEDIKDDFMMFAGRNDIADEVEICLKRPKGAKRFPDNLIQAYFDNSRNKATGKIKKGCEHMTNTIFYNGLQWENQRTAFNSFRKSDTHRPMVFAISWWASVILAYNSLMVAVMGCMRIRLTGLYTASTTAASTTTTITARHPHGTCHAAPK